MKKALALFLSVVMTAGLAGCASIGSSSDSLGNSSSSTQSSSSQSSSLEDSDGSSVSSESHTAYKAVIHINFTANLLFSTYDVDVSLDGIEQGKLAHGEDADYEFELEAGEHTLSFSSSESSSVSGSISFEVSDDIEASFIISCHSSEINVEEEYLINKNAAGDNEAMVPLSASDYKNKDYREIVQSLEEAGFTNVSAQAVYDIVWGITDEGSSDKVSIDGKTDFKRGEVFEKNVDIVVTYHLKEEDDPSRTSESDSSASSVTPQKPESSSSASSKKPESSSSASSQKPESSSSVSSKKPESGSSSSSQKPESSSSLSSPKPESSSSSTTNEPVSSEPVNTTSTSDEDIPYIPSETHTTGIELISMTNPLRRNEDAQITIKGAPNTRYSINVYYSSGRSTAAGLESKDSDSEGYVTWTWHVGGRTKLGDNKRVEIVGGGQTLTTTFSVVN